MGPVRLITADDLQPAAGTPGIQRWQAASDDGLWVGVAATDPEAASGWHHHSGNHTVIYLLEGRMRIEWGSDPDAAVEGEAGDFLLVPPETVHRELNPDAVPGRGIVIRIGNGEPVVNVTGPR